MINLKLNILSIILQRQFLNLIIIFPFIYVRSISVFDLIDFKKIEYFSEFIRRIDKTGIFTKWTNVNEINPKFEIFI